jgi:hypothetical protein
MGLAALKKGEHWQEPNKKRNTSILYPVHTYMHDVISAVLYGSFLMALLVALPRAF